MKNILVLGEEFPVDKRLRVICFRNIGDVNLRIIDKALDVFINNEGWVRIDGIIWRFLSQVKIKDEVQLLNLIKYSEIPCVNDAAAFLSFSNRLSVAKLLNDNQIKINPYHVYYGQMSKLLIEPAKFPAVFKTGDFHCGFGKVKLRNTEILADINDYSALLDDYITIEDYIDYKKDIRCLIIDNEALYVEKKSSNWKANVNPFSVEIVPTVHQINELSFKIKDLLGVNIVGIDWLQKSDGEWIVLETNLVPDLFCVSNDIEISNKRKVLESIIKCL